MEYKIEHKPPSFLETAFVAMLLGAVLVGVLHGLSKALSPQAFADAAQTRAEIPAQVQHLKELNTLEEGFLKGTQQSKIDHENAYNLAWVWFWRVAGIGGGVLIAAYVTKNGWGWMGDAWHASRTRKAEASLKEVHAEKGKKNPAFTPAGLFTHTTVIDGQTWEKSDLTGDMAPVRDAQRMAAFREAHMAVFMAIIAAKRDVLMAQAQAGKGKTEDVVLIGDGI